MSERQRLITKYLSRLTKGITTRYSLHLLYGEKDQGASQMLVDSLTQIAKETGNEQIKRAMDSVMANRTSSPKFWAKVSTKKEGSSFDPDATRSRPKRNYFEEGVQFMGSLLLDNALKSFEHAIKESAEASFANKFYKQRAEINLIQGRFNEAFDLSVKGKLHEMSFVAAIGAGRFSEADGLVTHIMSLLRSGGFDKDMVVSVFEVVHLVLFVGLACRTCEEVGVLIDQIRNATNYDLEQVLGISESFSKRDFARFWKDIPKLKSMWHLSIYTSPVSSQLKQAIVQNMVVNAARPFCRVSFGSLASELGMAKEAVMEELICAVRDGRLHGRVDALAGEFLGGNENREDDELVSIFVRTQALEERLTFALWKKEYLAKYHRPARPSKKRT